MSRPEWTPAARRAFLLAHTTIGAPPLVPEVRLHLGGEVMPLWEALREECGEASPPPLWAYAWAGGQAVARYLLDNPGEVRGKRVLDLGSGSGLCAIAAALAGAARVLAADVDVLAQDAITLNAALHGVEIAVTGDDLLGGRPPDVDLIVAGDVCYEEATARRVLSWLKRAYARGIAVLIGDPGREYFPRQELTLAGRYTIPTARDLEGVESKVAGVYVLP